MLEVFRQQTGISIALFVSMAMSILVRIILGALYRKMIHETDNMSSTNNKALKQCKLKFSNCYEMGNGVSNVAVFVDKFISRLSIGHMSFGFIYHLSGQLMLLSVVFSGVGVSRGIMAGNTIGDILPFYIVSLLGLYVFFSVSALVNINEKKRILKINLVDYLENHLSQRMNVTKQDIQMLYGEDVFAAGRRNRSGKADKSNREELTSAKNKGPGQDQESEDKIPYSEGELEELLKDFLSLYA